MVRRQYRASGTSIVIGRDLEGKWKFLLGSESVLNPEWVSRHAEELMPLRFSRLREATDYLEAFLASHPLPKFQIPAPESHVQRVADGVYRGRGGKSGRMFVIMRRSEGWEVVQAGVQLPSLVLVRSILTQL